MLESACLGMLGAALGVCLGITITLVVSAIGLPMRPPPNSDLDYIAEIRVLPDVVTGAAVIGMAACILSVVLPAFRMRRIDVADALRQNA